MEGKNYQICYTTDRQEIANITSKRLSVLTPFPKTFQQQSIFCADKRYTIKKPITFFYHQTPKQGQKLSVTLRPPQNKIPAITTYSDLTSKQIHSKNLILCNNLLAGKHNVLISNISFCEHYLSLLALNNLHLDCILNHPTFSLPSDMLETFYTTLEKDKGQNIQEIPAFSKKTINQPLLVYFPYRINSYIIFQPAASISLDHQICYTGKSIGAQRVSLTVTPEIFRYIARARTNLFIKKHSMYILSLLYALHCGIPGWKGVEIQDVLRVSPSQIFNKKSSFDDSKGNNLEFISHEIIDMLCWLKLIENHFHCKLVGEFICHRFGHQEQVHFAKWLYKKLSDPQSSIKLMDV